MSNADRVLGQLVVEAGILSAPQIESFLAEIDTGRRPPGSLLPLLVQSGRVPHQQAANLQQQVQQRLSTSPSDSQSSDLQRLISAGLLDVQRAAHISQALSNWRQQGRGVSVREAVLHFQLASPQQLDQILAPPSLTSSLSSSQGPNHGPNQGQSQGHMDEDFGKRTEVISFQRGGFFGGSNEFVSPVSNPLNSSFANSGSLPAAPLPVHQAAAGSGNNVFSPFSSRASGPMESPASTPFNPVSAPPPAIGPSPGPNPVPGPGPSPFNPMGAGAIGGAPSGPVPSPFGPSPFSGPASPPAISSPFSSAGNSPSFQAPASPFGGSPPPNGGQAARSPFSTAPNTRADRSEDDGDKGARSRGDSSRRAAQGSAKDKNGSDRRPGKGDKADKNAKGKAGRSKSPGRGSSSSSGMPLVPIAIALVGVLLSLGIVLVFYVMPKNKARKILNEARSLKEAKKFQEALDVLLSIDPRFAPPETETEKTDIFNEANSQVDEAIKDIDRLIGEDTPEVSTLTEAEQRLTSARELALKERVPDLDRARLHLDAAIQCREVRLKLRARQFKEAERLVRAINREHLTKDNAGIEGEILVMNRTFIKDRKGSVLSAAERGDEREAREVLRELREASVAGLAGELNTLDRDLRTRIEAFEERKRAGNVASELRALAEGGKRLELLMKVEELSRSNPASLQEPEVAAIINQNQRFFQNLWGSAISTGMSQVQAGNLEAAKGAVERLKVGPDRYLLFRVSQQGLGLEIVPQAHAMLLFPLMLEFLSFGRTITDLVKSGRKEEALNLHERLLVPNQPQKVYLVLAHLSTGGGAPAPGALPAGYQLVPEQSMLQFMKQTVEQIERGAPPR